MHAYVVGITGGIASGKSAVARLFADLGVTVADADVAARAIVQPGQPALQEIVDAFGTDVLLADGTLDRGLLRRRIFVDPLARHSLERITHPRIRALLEAQCRAAPGPYVIAAIPLLAETGVAASYPWLRRILVVDASVDLQRARLVGRDGIDEALASQMISAQASRGQRLALATDVLLNDGALQDLDAPVLRLDFRYRRLAAEGA